MPFFGSVHIILRHILAGVNITMRHFLACLLWQNNVDTGQKEAQNWKVIVILRKFKGHGIVFVLFS